MRFLIPSLILSLTIINAGAQQLKLRGIVADAASGGALQGVLIENRNSGTITASDAYGGYAVFVRKGDVLRFSLLGYTTKELAVFSDAEEQYERIPLDKQIVAIDTVVIRPGLSPYQKDSLRRGVIFGKKLAEKPAMLKFNKPHPLYGGTGSINAPISSLLQKKTKKYRRLKAFQDRFKKDEKQLFVDSRYTPVLVQELTGLHDDSLALFMNRYPLAYDYARSASDLELMMWIKYNYREWTGTKPEH